jgi:hypothetical protein
VGIGSAEIGPAADIEERGVKSITVEEISGPDPLQFHASSFGHLQEG